MTERKILERFIAFDDIGKEYAVLMYLETLSAFDVNKDVETVDAAQFMLESGEPLTEIGENKFEIVASGAILKRITQ